MLILSLEVIAVLCHDDGVDVYAERGHEVKRPEDHVGQFYGDPLGLARADFFQEFGVLK